jgi:type I restriction enzyme M protein
VEQTVCPDGKAFAIKKPVSLTIGEDVYDDLSLLTPDDIKAIAKRVTSERQELAVSVKTEDDGVYAFLPERCTIIHTDKDGKKRDLGCGAFSFKASVNKKQVVVHKIAIEPFLTSDYEIIPHHMDEHENQREVEAFMQKYVFKPYVLGKNVVGVELNFNKEFYVPEKIDNVNDVMEEIRSLNNELMGIIL